MVTIQEGHMVPLPFGSFTDPDDRRAADPRGRPVRATRTGWPREYMIRLEREDLEDPAKLDPIAAAAGMSPDDFRARYGYLAE